MHYVLNPYKTLKKVIDLVNNYTVMLEKSEYWLGIPSKTVWQRDDWWAAARPSISIIWIYTYRWLNPLPQPTGRARRGKCYKLDFILYSMFRSRIEDHYSFKLYLYIFILSHVFCFKDVICTSLDYLTIGLTYSNINCLAD